MRHVALPGKKRFCRALSAIRENLYPIEHKKVDETHEQDEGYFAAG